jgi:hypothetical protein
MAVLLPHIEDSHLTTYLPPKGEFERFQSEAHYIEKVKEWGLGASKKEFWFKGKTHQRLVKIIGYETFGDTSEYNTLVVEFQDGNLTCIHPAYLKEMQSSSFGKELKPPADGDTVKEEAVEVVEVIETTDTPEATGNVELISEDTIESQDISTPKETKAKTTKPKKEKPAKLVLPEDKVHFSASVKQFALSWNHFNEENDEVVVLENVKIENEEPVEIGLAWCAHSKTLKKFELSPGDQLEFDGKIVKKSLPKGKEVEDEALLLEVSVPYKVNNPSKLVKK